MSGVDAVEHRRRDEVARSQAGSVMRRAAGDEAGALGLPALDVVQDPVALALLTSSPISVASIGRVADLDPLRRLGEQLDDLLVDRALHQDPAPRAAILAALSKTAYGDSRANRSRSASAKTMFGLLPPSSRLTFLIVPAAVRRMSRRSRVSPVNAILPTPGCAPARRRRSARTRDDVEHSGREPASSASSPSRSAVSGDHEAGLSTAVLPGGERWSHLPAGHHQREVPGDDQADDADRLPEREVEPRPGHGDRLAVVLVRGAP